jgi:hypothetical protein
MSIYYSKHLLNSYWSTPYFQAHIPADYPVGITLQKCRAFRHLPPNLKQLATLARQWSLRVNGEVDGIDRWYDEDGYELNPDTGKRLSDKEIDAQWDGLDYPDFMVVDIPVPPGGFADPDTWEPEAEEEDVDTVDRSGMTEAQLLGDITSRGREATAREYGVPVDWLSDIESDQELARMILDMHGKPWPASNGLVPQNAPENRS